MGVAAMAMAAGTVVNAYGQVKAARAQSDSLNYNAAVSDQNADIAEQKAIWSGQEGVQNASNAQMKTAAEVAGITANQAGSGIDVNSGSAVDVRNSAKQVGLLDAMTIRSNAAREAYGYKVEAVSHRAQADLDRRGAKNAKSAGNIAALSTLLGGASQTSNYADYQSGKSLSAGV